MSILSKETIETPNIGDSAGEQSSASTRPAPGQIHSDAVSLEVQLKVHGSKVTEVVRGVTPHTEPFEEQTSSMIVFPHGGVLRMSTAVNAGQMLVLTNLKSRQDAICRVVKVRSYSSSSSYVEVEFTHRQQGFWGVYFESDAAEALANEPKAPASPDPAVNAEKSASGDSRFIHFGAQEEVQPAASSTNSASLSSDRAARQVAAPPVLRIASDATASKAMQPLAHAPSGGTATSPLGVNVTIPLSTPVSNNTKTRLDQDAISVAGQNIATDSLLSSEPAASAAPPAFGARLGTDTSSEGATESSKTWIFMAACAAILVLVIGGAVLLLRQHSPDVPAAAAVQPVVNPGAATPSTAATSAPATLSPAASATNSPVTVRQSPQAPVVKPSREMAVVRESPPVNEPAAELQPAAVPTPAPATKTNMPSVFGTLNAHPISERRSVTTSAPNVDTGAPSPTNNVLLGITSPANNSALPPPALNANVPLPVGGRIKEPQLVSHVLPQYPLLARQAHTQGDVTLEVVVDKAGNVTQAKAIAGPLVLRQAAMDAVRRWKYEPTSLDGQAVAVELLVTVRFQL